MRRPERNTDDFNLFLIKSVWNWIENKSKNTERGNRMAFVIDLFLTISFYVRKIAYNAYKDGASVLFTALFGDFFLYRTSYC